MNKMTILKSICVFVLSFLVLCGCNSDKENYGNKVYLPEICSVKEEKGVTVLSLSDTVCMGGNEYYGGVVLGNSNQFDKECYVEFYLKNQSFGNIKNVSFFLGSTHSPEAYFENSETVTVLVDGNVVVERTIHNDDLPCFYVINVENYESIRISTSGSGVTVGISELTAWRGDVENTENVNNDEDENSLSAVLVKDIKPYYSSEKESVSFIYSQMGDVLESGGKEYTDATLVFLPRLENTFNSFFTCFNLGGKYNTFSFELEGLEYDSEIFSEEALLLTVCVYADDKMVFKEKITSLENQRFVVPLEYCDKLMIMFKSKAGVPDLKICVSEMIVETK